MAALKCKKKKVDILSKKVFSFTEIRPTPFTVRVFSSQLLYSPLMSNKADQEVYEAKAQVC